MPQPSTTANFPVPFQQITEEDIRDPARLAALLNQIFGQHTQLLQQLLKANTK